MTDYENGKTPGLTHPKLGLVYRPSTSWRETRPEFTASYQTTEQGLRDHRNYQPYPNPGTKRILIIGDSIAFGASVNYEDSWAYKLEQKLQEKGFAVEIVKAGIEAFDTKGELLYLQQLQKQFHPDIVLLSFHPDDLFSNALPEEPIDEVTIPTEQLPVAVRPDKKFESHLIVALKRIMRLSDSVYVHYYLQSGWNRVIDATDFRKQQLGITKELLHKMQESINDRPLFVASIPHFLQVIVESQEQKSAGKIDSIVDAGAIDDILQGFAATQKIHWLPLLPILATAYKDNEQDTHFRYDGHLSEFGNEIVASQLAKELGSFLTAPSSQARM